MENPETTAVLGQLNGKLYPFRHLILVGGGVDFHAPRRSAKTLPKAPIPYTWRRKTGAQEIWFQIKLKWRFFCHTRGSRTWPDDAACLVEARVDWKTDGQSDGANGQRLLSIAGAAERCGVCRKTVDTWISKEGLPVHRLPGRGAKGMLRIAVDDLTDWLSQHRHDVAEEKKHDRRTLRLEGRRFLAVDGKSLGTSPVPASSLTTRERDNRS